MSAEISAVPAAARLRITETFLSLQGEANAVGWPTFFIRLTGCPLRCHYCDTAYAFHGGEWRTVARLVDEARESRARHVCVTGGEPLAQRHCTTLLTVLCEAGFEVSLETSGAIDASGVDPRVARVIDVKTPGSGEAQRNLDLAVHGLRKDDQLKFVICDRAGLRMEPRAGAAGAARRPLPGAVLAELPAACGRPARELDPRRPAAGPLPGAVAQGALG